MTITQVYWFISRSKYKKYPVTVRSVTNSPEHLHAVGQFYFHVIGLTLMVFKLNGENNHNSLTEIRIPELLLPRQWSLKYKCPHLQ